MEISLPRLLLRLLHRPLPLLFAGLRLRHLLARHRELRRQALAHRLRARRAQLGHDALPQAALALRRLRLHSDAGGHGRHGGRGDKGSESKRAAIHGCGKAIEEMRLKGMQRGRERRSPS